MIKLNRAEVKETVYAYEDKTIDNLNHVFPYNFPAEADTVLFEVLSGGYGLYSISITSMSDGEVMNYDEIQTFLDEVQFRINLEQFIDPKDDDYIKQIDKLDHIVFHLTIPFFSECFDQATNPPSHIRFYIRTHEAEEVFDLQTQLWLEIEDLYE